MKSPLGYHILADLYGVEPGRIDSVEDVKEVLEGAVKYANLTKISSHYYQFQPHGATGIVLLSESHISIHTWPELGVALVDIFTCSSEEQTFKALEFIELKLMPKDKKIKFVRRG